MKVICYQLLFYNGTNVHQLTMFEVFFFQIELCILRVFVRLRSGPAGLVIVGWEQSPIGISYVALSIKEMLNFRGNEGFEGCLENVLCVLEGKGSKIKLKSEQKKLIRQLYEIGITF